MPTQNPFADLYQQGQEAEQRNGRRRMQSRGRAQTPALDRMQEETAVAPVRAQQEQLQAAPARRMQQRAAITQPTIAPAPDQTISFSARIRNASRAALGGGVNKVAGLLESVAIGAERLDDLFSDRDGEETTSFGAVDADKSVEDYFTYQLGQTIRTRLSKYTEIDEDQRENLLSTILPNAVGGSVLQGIASRANPLLSAVLGAGEGGSDAYKDALRNGATEGEAFKRYLVGLGLGTTEAIPLNRMIDRLDKGTGGKLRSTIIGALKEGAEEAVQELLTTVAGNFADLAIYDENQDITDGALASTGVGFSAGAILGFATHLIFGKAARMRNGDVDQDIVDAPAPGTPSTGGAGKVTDAQGNPVAAGTSAAQAPMRFADIPAGEVAALRDPDGVIYYATMNEGKVMLVDQNNKATSIDGQESLVEGNPPLSGTSDISELGWERVPIGDPDAPVVAPAPAEVKTDAPVEPTAAASTVTPEPEDALPPTMAVPVKANSTVDRIQQMLAGDGKAIEGGLDLEQFGLTKARVEELRSGIGLGGMSPSKSRSWAQATYDAVTTGTYKRATLIISGQLAGEPKPLSDVERAGVALYLAEVAVDRERYLQEAEIAGQEGRSIDAKQALGQARLSEDILDQGTQAVNLGDSQAGRALNSAKFAFNAYRFNPVSMIREGAATKGAVLSADEETTIRTSARGVEIKQKEVDVLERDEAALVAKELEDAAEFELQTAVGAATDSATADADIAKLKAELNAMGMRVNDLTGVAPEAVYKIGQLALSYASKGITDLRGIVNVMQAALPTLTDLDVYTAITAKNPKTKAANVTATRKRINQLKTEARLMLEIDDAQQGVFSQRATRSPTAPEIKTLQVRLRGLKQHFYQTQRNQKSLETALGKITVLQQQLGVKNPTPADIDTARNMLADLRSIGKVDERIADMEEQLATGNFHEPVPRVTRARLPELEKRRIELKILQDQARTSIEALRPYKVGHFMAQGDSRLKATKRAVDAQFLSYASLPRTLKATADFSAALRQGLWVSNRLIRQDVAARIGVGDARNKGNAAIPFRVFGAAFNAFMDEHSAVGIDLAMRSHPLHVEREKSKLYLSTLTGGIELREEQFQSRLVAKIPGLGGVAQRSERHMVTTLNMLRAATFDNFIQQNPTASKETKEAFADYVNVATGRGRMNAGAAKFLSVGFFAPRFALSRFQTPATFLKYIDDPIMRTEVAKDIAGFVGTGATMLGLAAMAGLAVGYDPRDSDFGKIIIGNTRIDLWGGFQQPARLVLGAATGLYDVAYEKGATGRRRRGEAREQGTNFDYSGELVAGAERYNAYDAIENFASYKLSPTVTIPLSLISGENVIGQEASPLKTLGMSVVPLFFEEIWKASQSDNPLLNVPLAATSGVGIGVSIQDDPLRQDGVRQLLRRSGLSVTAPERTATMTDNEVKEMKKIFNERVAIAIQGQGPLLESVSPAEASDLMRAIMSDEREQVRSAYQ